MNGPDDGNEPDAGNDAKLAARRAALLKIAAFGATAPVMVAMLKTTKAAAASTGGPKPTPTPTSCASC